MREQLFRALEEGLEPDHYRIEWIRQSVNQVFDVLQTIALQFNDQHPDDKCSAQDLMDILNSAVATITAKATATD